MVNLPSSCHTCLNICILLKFVLEKIVEGLFLIRSNRVCYLNCIEKYCIKRYAQQSDSNFATIFTISSFNITYSTKPLLVYCAISSSLGYIIINLFF